MRLQSVRIRNFRSIHDLTVRIGALTRIVGANGAGKSTILLALELFYTPGTPNLAPDDFFERSESAEIEIALTFSEFTVEQRATFEARIVGDDTLTVSRVFIEGGGKSSGRYYGMALRHEPFSAIRRSEGARDRVAAYKQMREQGYPDLSEVTRAAEVEVGLQAWEATHQDRCELDRDDGQFFGFQNVGQGKLNDATMFVHIPAVRDASADVAQKNSPVAKLLELVVRSAVEARPEIQNFRANVGLEYRRLMDPANLTELAGLADVLSSTLSTLYADTSVMLKWQESGALVIPFPAADMTLDDDGIQTTVDKTGHGLQRALIFTLLQHLAVATIAAPSNAEGQTETPRPLPQPGLLLAIEEPELYQHPTKQRHIARVLARLASGELPGVAAETQVILTTHSPLFISMECFDEVRIVRRQRPATDQKRRASLSSVQLDDVARRLEKAHSRPAGSFTAASLKPKLHIIDAIVSEGFFASVSVLVEGESDRAALLAMAALKNFDLGAAEIAVIPTGGKTNIDKPYAIFQLLGIPVYAIWDSDEGIPNNVACNKALQLLAGCEQNAVEDTPERVTSNYACFKKDIEATLKAEIGVELWNELIDLLKEEYGIGKRSDAQKVPAIMTQLLAEAAKRHRRSETLEKILDAILDLKPHAA